MMLTNNVVHAVAGEDGTLVKFMVNKDKKGICYINHLSDSMKIH